MLKGDFFTHRLNFKFTAGTSRGNLHVKDTWFIKVWDDENPSVVGFGECGPLQGLSPDPLDALEKEISKTLKDIEEYEMPGDHVSCLEMAGMLVRNHFPSLRFALETALLDLLNGGERMIIKNDFYTSGMLIPINGLIWMNEKGHMIDQAQQKIAEGFGCIKMKIGAINFEEELEVLNYIRSHGEEDITLRVDANGAFSEDEVIGRIERLSAYSIHSIEQPIKAGNWKAMAAICKESAIPIALDEELIGMGEKKEDLLHEIQPQYIVLKPTLHGGFSETAEWIELADKYNIGWWITSMLESNIGLNAICQFAAEKSPNMVHGLGTGKLYSNNIESPLTIQNGHISYLNTQKWDYTLFPNN